MRTQSFVRKSTVGPVKTKVLLFYVNRPAREIKGISDFKERVVGKPDDLWQKYGRETVFQSREEFSEFMQGRDRATFIRFRNLRELARPIPLKELLKTMRLPRLSRSGKYISRDMADRLIGGDF